VGAHVSVAGGLLEGVIHARAAGCEAAQIFPKNPRRWDAPQRPLAEEQAFRVGCIEAGVTPVFSHATYLINPGTADEALWSRSCRALSDEILRAEGIGASGLVMHLGTRASPDTQGCVRRVVETALRGYSIAGTVAVPLLIENAAGAGSQFGSRLDEVTSCLLALREAGVPAGICIDTCHAFAAGVDLRGEEGWSTLAAHLDATCGAGSVALIHANDSKGCLGCKHDRHEWIGDGQIGEPGFLAMFAAARLAGAAAIVEMPGDPLVKDSENVSRLKRLRDGAGGAADPLPSPS